MRLPIIFATVIALFTGSVFAQNLVWQTAGVVFSDPTIHNVEVVPLSDGRYRMYFDLKAEIKSAISTDGKSFTIESGTRLTGSMPAIIKLSETRWRIYFATPSGKDGSANIIKSAISSDGLKWSVEAGTRLATGGTNDLDNIGNPTVISLPNGGYRMYYDGEVRKTEQEFTWRILSATSPDGLIWTKDPGIRLNIGEPPLSADLIWSAHAEYYNLTQTYQLYFSTSDGIYLATSSDGTLFTVQPEPELSGPDQDPFVLNLPEGKRMYYWVNGEGTYFADLKEAQPSQNDENPAWWEKLIKGQFPEINLPANWHLYIVPAILLIGGTAAVIFLLRSRSRR